MLLKAKLGLADLFGGRAPIGSSETPGIFMSHLYLRLKQAVVFSNP
jgi:hypothetical protein